MVVRVLHAADLSFLHLCTVTRGRGLTVTTVAVVVEVGGSGICRKGSGDSYIGATHVELVVRNGNAAAGNRP